MQRRSFTSLASSRARSLPSPCHVLGGKCTRVLSCASPTGAESPPRPCTCCRLQELGPKDLARWMCALAHLQTVQLKLNSSPDAQRGAAPAPAAASHGPTGSAGQGRSPAGAAAGSVLAPPRWPGCTGPVRSDRPRQRGPAAGTSALPMLRTFVPASVRLLRKHHASRFISGRLFWHLQASIGVRMADMGLTELSRCAWAAAKLKLRVGPGWLAALARNASRSLAGGRTDAKALVRLAWGLAALSRQQAGGATQQRQAQRGHGVRLQQRQQPPALRQRLLACETRPALTGICAVAAAAGGAGDGGQGSPPLPPASASSPAAVDARSYGQGRLRRSSAGRAWPRALLVHAMQHLPSLDNHELLRLTYSLYWMRAPRPTEPAVLASYISYCRRACRRP